MRRLWVLNLDAELELSGRPSSGRARAATARWASVVAASLPEGDAWIARFEGDAPGWQGAAWCPTPGALRLLEARGARPPRAPALDVLRRVNDRAFAHAIEPLPGAARVLDVESVAVPAGRRVWLRRGLAFAGKGVRRATGPLDEADRAFLRASVPLGSVFVEPEVEVLLDVALHGHTDGRRGRLTVASLDRGQWRGARLAEPGEVTSGERRRMAHTLERAADALVEAGYEGPFGIDGFRWRDSRGRTRFHPLSDLNARFSMGWALGMGGWG